MGIVTVHFEKQLSSPCGIRISAGIAADVKGLGLRHWDSQLLSNVHRAEEAARGDPVHITVLLLEGHIFVEHSGVQGGGDYVMPLNSILQVEVRIRYTFVFDETEYIGDELEEVVGEGEGPRKYEGR